MRLEGEGGRVVGQETMGRGVGQLALDIVEECSESVGQRRGEGRARGMCDGGEEEEGGRCALITGGRGSKGGVGRKAGKK